MAGVIEYKCLNCHAGLRFKPEKGLWVCDYCLSEFTKEQLDAASQDDEKVDNMHEVNHGLGGGAKEHQHVHHHEAHESEQATEEGMQVFHCTSCGAELIADATTSATFCVYCKSPVIIKQRLEGEFKPRYVIPFKVTKDEAMDIYKTWINKKLFTPSAYKRDEEIDKITGIYAPFWLFDCRANASSEGNATKVTHWRAGDYEYTKTRHYLVERRGRVNYEKVPVDSSKKLDDTFMQMIEPYDYRELTDFAMQYMSGFMAEKYDVQSEESALVMKSRVDEFASSRLRETINGYTTYLPKHEDVNLMNVSHEYALMPIYLLVNVFNEKKYMFFINGQTGKVVGETPIDPKKQVLFFLAVSVLAWILMVFGGALFD